MSNDLTTKHRSTQPATIYLKCLPCGTTETQVADALWEKIGLNCDPGMISVNQNGRGECSAVIIIDRFCAADFIGRCFEAAGEKLIKVEPAQLYQQKARAQERDAYKVTKRIHQLEDIPSADRRHTEQYVERCKEKYGDRSAAAQQQSICTIGDAVKIK